MRGAHGEGGGNAATGPHDRLSRAIPVIWGSLQDELLTSARRQGREVNAVGYLDG